MHPRHNHVPTDVDVEVTVCGGCGVEMVRNLGFNKDGNCIWMGWTSLGEVEDKND